MLSAVEATDMCVENAGKGGVAVLGNLLFCCFALRQVTKIQRSIKYNWHSRYPFKHVTPRVQALDDRERFQIAVHK